ncbi:family 1 glycosylhydrolase [Bacillus licheniformis]|nr:family 1 glycosylhydrolase [Bacillus licheniformis]
MYDRYQLPLIVTENGLGAFDQLEDGDVVNDDYRIDYLKEHIKQIQLAITDGVDVSATPMVCHRLNFDPSRLFKTLRIYLCEPR